MFDEDEIDEIIAIEHDLSLIYIDEYAIDDENDHMVFDVHELIILDEDELEVEVELLDENDEVEL